MVKINFLIDGGNMKPGPAIAQQLGPMNINIGKVISEINESTKSFKGTKVPVELDIDDKTKNFTINISSPPTSELLKKELNIEKGTNKNKELKVANASIGDIIKVAKIKFPNMLDKNLKSTVKSILGTCASIGILVENKNPLELVDLVSKGEFDLQINNENSETSNEKRKMLSDFFLNVKSQQDAKIAAEKKAAEEAAAKVEETKTAASVAPTAKAPEKVIQKEKAVQKEKVIQKK